MKSAWRTLGSIVGLYASLALAGVAAAQDIVNPGVNPSWHEGLFPPPTFRRQLPEKLTAAAMALDKGDAAKARDLARAFVKEEPRSALGHEFLGAVALAQRDLAEADRELAEAVRLEPNRATAHMGLGRVALARGEAAKAEAAFRRGIEIEPKLLPARTGLALALLRQRQITRAATELQESLRVSGGTDMSARYLLASISYELGNLDDAERLLAPLATRGDQGPVGLLGMVMLERGRGTEARVLLERAASRDRASPWGRLAKSVVDAETGQGPSARTALEQLVKDQPQWEMAHRELGVVLLRFGQRDAGLKALEKAEALASDPDIARVRTGRLLLARGDTEGALARARAAFASPTAAAHARALAVLAHRRAGKVADAERDLESAARARPRDASALLDLGRFYLALGRPKEALAQFESAAKVEPAALEPTAGQVQALLALKRGADAEALVTRALATYAQSPDLHALRASVREGLGKAKAAEADYAKALELQPHHLIASRGLAGVYERDRRGKQAATVLEDAAKANPEAVAPLADLAALQVRAGDQPAAIGTYRRALGRDPTDALILNNLAYLLAADPKTRDEALKLAESAQARTPGQATSADTLGWILYLKGDLARAETLIAQAVAAAPGNPQIRYHLGKVYVGLGKRAEARGELERALSAGSFPEAADARATLKDLK